MMNPLADRIRLSRTVALSLLLALALVAGSAQVSARTVYRQSADVVYGGPYGALSADALYNERYSRYESLPADTAASYGARTDVPVYIAPNPADTRNAGSRYTWTSYYDSSAQNPVPAGLRIRIDPRTGEMYSELPTDELNRLPARNVYDPLEQRNKPITDYSYEQLAAWMNDAEFRKWNELPAVCASLEVLFKKSPAVCGGSVSMSLSSRTVRAYVDVGVARTQTVTVPAPQVRQVRIVDPVYPPWSPTYNPYW